MATPSDPPSPDSPPKAPSLSDLYKRAGLPYAPQRVIPEWVATLARPETTPQLNDAATPVLLAVMLVVGVAVIVPIVQIVQDLTALGFGWVLGWILIGLSIAAVWIAHELLAPRAHGAAGALRVILRWYAVTLRTIGFVLAAGLAIAIVLVLATRQPYVALTASIAGALIVFQVKYPGRISGWLMTDAPVRSPGDPVGVGEALAKSLNNTVWPFLLGPAATVLIARSWSLSAGLLLVIVISVAVFGAVRVWRYAPSRTAALVLLITLTSLVFSWGLLSAWHSWRSVASPAIPPANVRKAEINRRVALQASWRGPVIAAALSGGGYRAALAHAGLLSTLDEAGIPVHILSTVSGGSIVGGSYAAGWTPEQFHHYLATTRPGLPLDVLNAGNVLRRAISRRQGSGETFARHLARNYFSDFTLEDVGPPTLVVNATNFRSGTRASFWPHQPHAVSDLAHLVAASGAFPGAFDPVYLGDDLYVDGGVMENLGVDGLTQYLTDPANAAVPTPSVLIVSDVSAEPAPPAGSGPPPLLASVLRAEDLVYQRLHARIFASYSNNKFDASRKEPHVYDVDAGSLWQGRTGRVRVFIVSPASPGERGKLPTNDKALAQSVADISTLLEPSPAQVDAAFWLGATVSRLYLRDLCAATQMPKCPSLGAPRHP